MAGKISIAMVLEALRGGEKAALCFIRATGSRRGTKKTVNQVLEGYNYQSFKERTPIAHLLASHQSKVKKHALNGTIPLIDLDNDGQLTVLISHIIKFNGLQVIH